MEAGLPWRATFTENGRRRFRQAMTEAGLPAKLDKVTERLRARAPDLERPGADLIAWYLNPDRLPVDKRWSRKHAHTQPRPGHDPQTVEPLLRASATLEVVTTVPVARVADIVLVHVLGTTPAEQS